MARTVGLGVDYDIASMWVALSVRIDCGCGAESRNGCCHDGRVLVGDVTVAFVVNAGLDSDGKTMANVVRSSCRLLHSRDGHLFDLRT